MITRSFKRLRAYLARHWCVEIRNEWPSAEGEHDEDVTAGRIVTGVFWLWFAFVPLAIWLAFGQMPGWLERSVVAVHWVFAVMQLLTYGLPPLVLPFFLIWLLFPGSLKKVKHWKDPHEEWEEGYDDLAKLVEEHKEQGVYPEDYQLPPKRRDDFDEYLKRLSPDRPAFRLAIKIAGVILIAALIMSGRPVLAAIYAFPSVGWLLLEGYEWIMLRRHHG